MSAENLNKSIVSGIILYPALCITILILLAVFPIYQEVYPLTTTTMIPIVLFFTGLSIRKVGVTLADMDRRSLQPALICIGLLLSGLSLWTGSQYLDASRLLSVIAGDVTASQVNAFKTTLSFTLLAGFAVLALSSLALYGARSKSLIVSGGSEWLLGSRLTLTFATGFLVVYLVLIRPEFLSGFEYLPLLDWGLVAFLAWAFFRSARKRISENLSAPPEPPSWRKHLQEIETKIDGELVEFECAQKLFVESGIKEYLLVHLIKVIQESRMPEGDAPHLVRHLVDYQDDPAPVFAFGWEKDRVEKKNKRARESLLSMTMNTIRRWEERRR